MATNARNMEPIVLALAAELRAESARQRLTLRALSEASGVPHPTLSKSLTGKRVIDIGELGRIADALGVPAHLLVARAEAFIAAAAEPEEAAPTLTPDEFALAADSSPNRGKARKRADRSIGEESQEVPEA